MNLKSEIRKSYLLNKYVVITPGRIKRPRDVKEETIIKRAKDCYFCTESIDKQQKEQGNYIIDELKINNVRQVTSVKNIFPTMTPENDKAYGYQEVVIDTPHHHKELADLSEEEIGYVLEMYKKRTLELSKDKKINYILCFKNQGSKAGASLIHSHSQIFATEIIPPDLQEESNLIQNYKEKNKTCPYCDIIKKESKSKRLIFEDKQVIAFTPFASEYHYEAWIFPKRHTDNITTLNQDEFKSFASILKKILTKLKKIDLSYNYFMHQVISDKNQHFYIKVQPRDSIWAGVELGSGLVINSISPEVAAEYFRE
ncbi:galactose-1-phosphate uridylyltransferase [Candidatus Parcubacteria bacterium]|nr:galactose-1-phosphate uridylyltransferase [Candidatus Parcubacteria bacterium]